MKKKELENYDRIWVGPIVFISILIFLGFILVYPTNFEREVECNIGDVDATYAAHYEERQKEIFNYVEDEYEFENYTKFVPEYIEFRGFSDVNCKIKGKGSSNIVQQTYDYALWIELLKQFEEDFF